MGEEFKKTERGKAIHAMTMNFGGKNSPFLFDRILTVSV